MTEALLNTVGQSLVAIGLYTVAFESMVLSFRAQMHGYLTKHEPDSLASFVKACETANKTLKFCTPKMLEVGVLNQIDIDALVVVRRRRNAMAHEGYNEMLNLTVQEIEDDVALIFKLSRKVEQWRQSVHEPTPDGSIPFSIAPSIFGLYLSVAQELARTKLNVEEGLA
jgi:hypothetical protein